MTRPAGRHAADLAQFFFRALALIDVGQRDGGRVLFHARLTHIAHNEGLWQSSGFYDAVISFLFPGSFMDNSIG